jgi:hypothetical protein
VTDHSGAQPPPPHWRRRQPRVWPAVRGGVVAGIVMVLVAGLAACGSSNTTHGRSSPGPSASGAQSNSVSGPSACITKNQPAAGSGPWKVVQLKTLCGLPVDTSPAATEATQESLTSTKLVFSPVDGQANPGTETSGFAVNYQIPSSYDFERFINVVAFNGTFNQQAAMSELAQLDGGSFHSVPPGPHGGLMQCKPSYNNEECIFGTSTTLGDFTIADTRNELIGANTPVNAIRIRDALEVSA